MDLESIQNTLVSIPVGEIRYYPTIDSTNTVASLWLNQGAPNLSLVVADEQTAGRGRNNRKWFTPPGAALAFSLILNEINPDKIVFTEPESIVARFAAWGAVSVCQALNFMYGIPVGIKWPNDILINREKVSGILAEAQWIGDRLSAVILGIGVNVTSSAVPNIENLNFPATYIEAHLDRPVSRVDLLKSIVTYLCIWSERLASPEFLRVWRDHLAFIGETVYIYKDTNSGMLPTNTGKFLGISDSGALQLHDEKDGLITIHSGEIHLRPQEV